MRLSNLTKALLTLLAFGTTPTATQPMPLSTKGSTSSGISLATVGNSALLSDPHTPLFPPAGTEQQFFYQLPRSGTIASPPPAKRQPPRPQVIALKAFKEDFHPPLRENPHGSPLFFGPSYPLSNFSTYCGQNPDGTMQAGMPTDFNTLYHQANTGFPNYKKFYLNIVDPKFWGNPIHNLVVNQLYERLELVFKGAERYFTPASLEIPKLLNHRDSKKCTPLDLALKVGAPRHIVEKLLDPRIFSSNIDLKDPSAVSSIEIRNRIEHTLTIAAHGFVTSETFALVKDFATKHHPNETKEVLPRVKFKAANFSSEDLRNAAKAIEIAPDKAWNSRFNALSFLGNAGSFWFPIQKESTLTKATGLKFATTSVAGEPQLVVLATRENAVRLHDILHKEGSGPAAKALTAHALGENKQKKSFAISTESQKLTFLQEALAPYFNEKGDCLLAGESFIKHALMQRDRIVQQQLSTTKSEGRGR